MADVSTWSPNDAANNDAPPDGWPEGMPASAVNDTGRSTHGAVRRLAEDGGWFDWGHTYTYVDGDTFQVTGTFTPNPYQVGRSVRIIQTSGTLYGVITGVTESANTAVDVSLDGTIANEAMAVSLGLEAQAGAGGALTGEIKTYAGSAAPAGYLLCNGASVSTTTYAALFAVIDYDYGGSGGSFNLPDLVGRAPMGAGTSSDPDVSAIAFAGDGTSSGKSTHTLTGAESGTSAHEHVQEGGSFLTEAQPQTPTGLFGAGSLQGNTDQTAEADAISPHTIQSPYLGVNFIIKI